MTLRLILPVAFAVASGTSALAATTPTSPNGSTSGYQQNPPAGGVDSAPVVLPADSGTATGSVTTNGAIQRNDINAPTPTPRNNGNSSVIDTTGTRTNDRNRVQPAAPSPGNVNSTNPPRRTNTGNGSGGQ